MTPLSTPEHTYRRSAATPGFQCDPVEIPKPTPVATREDTLQPAGGGSSASSSHSEDIDNAWLILQTNRHDTHGPGMV